VGRGDFLLNLSWTSRASRSSSCAGKGALYLDTCIEPCRRIHGSDGRPAKRTNYALREAALALRETMKRAPTAVLTHGANPGLVSHFVKQALLNIAPTPASSTAIEHARGVGGLAHKLGVKVNPRRERDTQVASFPRSPASSSYVVRGRLRGRRLQPAELGWGSHEKNWPRDGRKHDFGRGSRST